MKTAKLGDRGYKVALAQAYLSLRKFMWKIDGIYDVETKLAVIDFQERLGVARTGEFSFGLVGVYEAMIGNVVARGVGDSNGSILPKSGWAWDSESALVKEAQKMADIQKSEVGSVDNTWTKHDDPIEEVSYPNVPFNNVTQGTLPAKKGSADMMVKIVRKSNPGMYVEFPGIPEELSDNNQANYTAIQTKGRSAPFQDYENSGPRQFNFTYEFYADYLPNHDIKGVVSNLVSFTHPEKKGNIRPPTAIFSVSGGSDVSFQCVVNTVQVTWKKPIINNHYSRATVSISLTEVVDKSKLYTEKFW